MRFRRIVLPTVSSAVVAAVVSALVGGPNIASAATTSLSDVLGALHRNAKVSERLNAGFFRAPQTQNYVASAFRQTVVCYYRCSYIRRGPRSCSASRVLKSRGGICSSSG